jgi:hypothetical protein
MNRRSFLGVFGLSALGATSAAVALKAAAPPAKAARLGPELATPLSDWREHDGKVIMGSLIVTGTITANHLEIGSLR